MIYNAMFLCGLFLMLIVTRASAEELMLRTPLVPARSATVYAGMNARMQQVNFEMGDRVTQGDTLMVLTRRDLRVKEAAARIALKKVQTLQTRWEVLHEKKLISDQQLENVRFDAEVAHCNWVAARMELDRTAIIAPQDGMVVEVNVKPGDWVLAYSAVARPTGAEKDGDPVVRATQLFPQVEALMEAGIDETNAHQLGHTYPAPRCRAAIAYVRAKGQGVKNPGGYIRFLLENDALIPTQYFKRELSGDLAADPEVDSASNVIPLSAAQRLTTAPAVSFGPSTAVFLNGKNAAQNPHTRAYGKR